MSVYGRGLKITRTTAVLPGRQAAESSVMWDGFRTTFLAALIAVNRSAKSVPPRPPQRRSSRDRPQAQTPNRPSAANGLQRRLVLRERRQHFHNCRYTARKIYVYAHAQPATGRNEVDAAQEAAQMTDPATLQRQKDCAHT